MTVGKTLILLNQGGRGGDMTVGNMILATLRGQKGVT